MALHNLPDILTHLHERTIVVEKQANLRKLRLLLNERFSDEELHTLCFDLHVDYDNLSGDNKAAKARSLITHLNNRGRLDELLRLIRIERPELQDHLRDLVEDAPTPVKTTASTDTPADGEQWPGAIETVTRALHRRRLLLFLGADLSADVTRLPDRQTLADALAQSEGIEPGRPLTAVAQQVMHFGNRFAFTQFLREQLDLTGHAPQPFHRLIAGLVQENELETIITTAYDGLLEQAFRQGGHPLTVVVSDTDLQFTSPQQPTLIKLFGDWQQPASLIVTEQDQNNLLNGRLPEKQALLDTIRLNFRMQTVLFVGVDLRDTAVSMLFDTVTGGRFQQPAFALWSGMAQREADAWQSNRNLTIIDANPVDFLQSLLQS